MVDQGVRIMDGESPYDGHPMTGRDPQILADLIEFLGDTIWMGPDGSADRGDRYSQNRKIVPTVRDRRLNRRGELT